MEFTTKGEKFVLRGARTPEFKLINNKSFAKIVQQGAELCFMSVSPHHTELFLPTCHLLQTKPNMSSPINPNSALLNEYSNIFTEPTQLPALRPGLDHKIPLKEGSKPFNLRPYRYSIIQKDIMDNSVNDLLNPGVIEHSICPYASPTILVKKKDGSWRLCVDYRRLNQSTIKHSFPIPLIEELMDELEGSVVFSKLDLRSGYHQVRMCQGEEGETAFKTRSGHFEYRVMPFGITSALATFQALMNHIFNPFIRKFIVFFFDDILVYSPSLEDHIAHLHLTFQTIRDNNLFLHHPKCCFATNKVEYLGHFITAEGVSTDLSKNSVFSHV